MASYICKKCGCFKITKSLLNINKQLYAHYDIKGNQINNCPQCGDDLNLQTE